MRVQTRRERISGVTPGRLVFCRAGLIPIFKVRL